MASTGRPKRIVAETDRRRWEDLRSRVAADGVAEFESCTNDLPTLDTLAWLTGMVSLADRIDDIVKQARREGESWAAIAIALGEPEGEEAANRLASRYRKRGKSSN